MNPSIKVKFTISKEMHELFVVALLQLFIVGLSSPYLLVLSHVLKVMET